MQRHTIDGLGLLRSRAGLLAAIAAGLLTGACSGGLGNVDLAQGLGIGQQEPAAETQTAEVSQSDLDRAVSHWGKEYEKNPRSAKNALAYAKNLKAANRKPEALAVLQQASFFNASNREIASEYGRLALEAGQVSLAQKLLAAADDPAKPDWRVISARGTALAKQGSYAEAIPFYERAAALAPSQASVQSNLAMAYAANGQPAKAEEILRRVAGNGDAKVRQNLALVVGLQGKYDEARTIAAADLPPEAATANVEYVRSMVRIPEQKAVVQAKAPPVANPVIQAKAEKAAKPAKPDLRNAAPADTHVATTVGGWETKVAAGR